MAQRSVANFKATKESRYGDNTAGEISASDSRNMFEDVADSFVNKTDDVIDDDTFATASPNTVPTSESVKAYVDANAGANADQRTFVFDDFIVGSPGYVTFTNFNDGGGLGSATSYSQYGVDGTYQAAGVRVLSTASSTAGGAAVSTGTIRFTFGHGFKYRTKWRMALSDVSDGTESFEVRVGVMDGISAGSPANNGAFFRYTHSANSGKWEAVTALGGTETTEDTGIAAAADGYHTFEIVSNEDATSVAFYIDGVLVAEITTNIINADDELAGLACTIIKTAGSTARMLYIDYFEFEVTRTTPR